MYITQRYSRACCLTHLYTQSLLDLGVVYVCIASADRPAAPQKATVNSSGSPSNSRLILQHLFGMPLQCMSLDVYRYMYGNALSNGTLDRLHDCSHSQGHNSV